MILVFVGAGGSAAVDPEQYPTTRRFFELLPGEIKNHPLYESLYRFIATQKEEKKIDIEDLVGALDEFQALYKIMSKTDTLMGWAINGSVSGIGSTNIGALTAMQSERVRPLNDLIKEQIYAFYGEPPVPGQLSTWTVLLNGLEKLDPHLEIFTTNYDLVLEEAIKQSTVEVELGLIRADRRTTVSPLAWNADTDALVRGKYGMFTKLHGSVDWRYYRGDVIVAEPEFSGDHGRHCVLYPGYKGVPTQEPFIAFHRYLRNVVQGRYGKLTAAVFIGFAFRDDYINSILAELSSESVAYTITQSGAERPAVPFSVTFAHDGSGLTDETALRCLSYLHDQIETSPGNTTRSEGIRP